MEAVKNIRRQLGRNGFVTTTLDNLVAWARMSSLHALSLGNSCCAENFFEGSSFDLQETGIEPVLNPRHADILLVPGALSLKSVPVIRRIYDQMPEPKTVMVLGNCSCGGGLFAGNYAVVSDLSDILPVDVYVTGCPPSRASFVEGIRLLRQKIYAQVTE